MTAPVLDKVEETLKPCPFCGSVPMLDRPLDDDDKPLSTGYWIFCTGCDAFLGGVADESTIEDVVGQWNRRTRGAE